MDGNDVEAVYSAMLEAAERGPRRRRADAAGTRNLPVLPGTPAATPATIAPRTKWRTGKRAIRWCAMNRFA